MLQSMKFDSNTRLSLLMSLAMCRQEDGRLIATFFC